MVDGKYNLKNPAVKRILQEVKEMQSNPSDDFMSLPLEVSFPHASNILIFFVNHICLKYIYIFWDNFDGSGLFLYIGIGKCCCLLYIC